MSGKGLLLAVLALAVMLGQSGVIGRQRAMIEDLQGDLRLTVGALRHLLRDGAPLASCRQT